MKLETILEALCSSDTDAPTLFYAVALDGVDVESVSDWDSQYVDVGKMVLAAHDALIDTDDETEKESIACDFGNALEKIFRAMIESEREKSSERKGCGNVEEIVPYDLPRGNE
jgi:hypothetical protein